jgi:hypothetical protein
MARCGALTTKGRRCRNKVKKAGDYCWQHSHGSAPRLRLSAPRRRPAASSQRSSRGARRSPSSRSRSAPRYSARAAFVPQAPAPPPPSRRVQKRERVKEAALFCADSLSDSWQAAVADRITGYAQTTWERLSRSRRKRNCKALAQIARSILEAKTQIHRTIGKLFGWAVAVAGASDAARAFTEELISNIPLPFDAKMIAVARGVQVAGILLCVTDNRDLTKCECFIDLALTETKERVNQILIAAMSDWTGLAQFSTGSSPP